MSDIRFGIGVQHNIEDAKQAYTDVVAMGRRTQAEQLGIAIMDKKGWRSEEQDGILYSSQDVYVFTAKELREFVRLKGGTI